MNNRLRVARCRIAMPTPLEVRPELCMVIDLAVKDDPDRPVLVGHGLVSAHQVNDAQTPKAQSHRTQDDFTVVVGAAMTNGICHRPQVFARKTGACIKIDYSADSAHRLCAASPKNTSMLLWTSKSERSPLIRTSLTEVVLN